MTADFTARCIAKCQRLDFETSAFCRAVTETLIKAGKIVWDDDRALFWAIHPQGPQVAVWMVAVALKFEPRGK